MSGSFGPDPRGSSASVISNRSVGRPRRSSVSAPRPSTRGHSPPPTSKHLDVYNSRLEPHSSSTSGRPRRGSVYAPSSGHNARMADPRASLPTFRASDPKASSSSIRRTPDEEARRGSTRFPRKFVNREAVVEAGFPFEEDRETGAITVFKAMSKSQIDDLIERTAVIRLSKERHGRVVSDPIVRHGHGGLPHGHGDSHGRGDSHVHGDTRRHSRHDSRESPDRHVAFAPTKTVITHEEVPTTSGALPAGREYGRRR